MPRRRSPSPNPKLRTKNYTKKEVVIHQLPADSTDHVQALVKDTTNNPCTVNCFGQGSNPVTHKVRKLQGKSGGILCTESRKIFTKGLLNETSGHF